MKAVFFRGGECGRVGKPLAAYRDLGRIVDGSVAALSGNPPSLSTLDRNIIERLIGWLKECRHVFVRYEKTAKDFAGMIRVAFIQRYLRLATR